MSIAILIIGIMFFYANLAEWTTGLGMILMHIGAWVHIGEFFYLKWTTDELKKELKNKEKRKAEDE